MVDFQGVPPYDWADFLEVLRLLRSPDGCPWDREQTHQSIRRNFLEETYEALEAIDSDDATHLREELGDVLLQVGFHAVMEEERGRFSADDVVNAVTQKLVYRHPHVFGNLHSEDSQEALVRWEDQKRKEKGHQSVSDTLDAVSPYLPSLWRAEKISKKTNLAGFRWHTILGALDKLEEEVAELRSAIEQGLDPQGPHGAMEELGDVLFMAARVAQMQKLDPETALHQACDKFNARFRQMEDGAQGVSFHDFSEEELVALWTKTKQSKEG